MADVQTHDQRAMSRPAWSRLRRVFRPGGLCRTLPVEVLIFTSVVMAVVGLSTLGRPGLDPSRDAWTPWLTIIVMAVAIGMLCLTVYDFGRQERLKSMQFERELTRMKRRSRQRRREYQKAFRARLETACEDLDKALGLTGEVIDRASRGELHAELTREAQDFAMRAERRNRLRTKVKAGEPAKPLTTLTVRPGYSIVVSPLLERSPLATPSGVRRPFTGFDRERATYERLKPELFKTAEGKFVVIVGEEVIGPLGRHEDAECAGYARFGLGPLYIKQVLAEEPVAAVSRCFAP